MSAIHPDLKELADSAEIVSPTIYTVLGETHRADEIAAEPFEVLAGDPLAEETLDWRPHEATAELSPILRAVQSVVYERLYTRPTAAQFPSDSTARRVHSIALSEANCGCGSWEPGWAVRGESDEDGRLSVVKSGITFWAPPACVRAHDQIRPGVACRVKVPKELRNLVPGYYCAIGDADLPDGQSPTIRLYWHLTAEAAAPFVESVSTFFNARGIPFRAKVLSDPADYRRADSGVLYLGREDWDRTSEGVCEIHDRLAPRLRTPIPMFTKNLAPGLALAEDPANGKSFGQHRCGLAALALWRAFLSGIGNVREFRLAAITDVFREADLDPERPYLNPRSIDDYRFQAP